MNIPEEIITGRMKMRFLNLGDVNDVCRQFSDPDMTRYFSDPPCDVDEAKEIIEHYLNPKGKDYLRYGMFDKDNDAFIGTCGYHFWDQEKKQVEIGYDVWKEFWRMGYMTEALPVLIDLCFQVLQVNCIYIITHQQNKASIATVKKFGFALCEPCREINGKDQICLRLTKKQDDIKE